MSSSTSSNGSNHSLRSHGPIDPVELKKNQTKRKPAAFWTSEEEAVFIDFLLSQFSASGDGNPKNPTFTAAASLLKERFPNASSAEKTASVCKNKWQSVCYQSRDQGPRENSKNLLYFVAQISISCCHGYKEHIRIYIE